VKGKKGKSEGKSIQGGLNQRNRLKKLSTRPLSRKVNAWNNILQDMDRRKASSNRREHRIGAHRIRPDRKEEETQGRRKVIRLKTFSRGRTHSHVSQTQVKEGCDERKNPT